MLISLLQVKKKGKETILVGIVLDFTYDNSANTLDCTELASKFFREPSWLHCVTLTYCKKGTSVLWFIFIVRIIAEPISSIVAIGEAKHHYAPQSVWVIKPFGRIISCVCWFSQRREKNCCGALQLYVMLHLCISFKGLKCEAVHNCSGNGMSNRIHRSIPMRFI